MSVESPYFSGEMTCVLDAPVADFIVGNVPQVPSPVSQDESCSFAAVTRARSKLVVDKEPLSRVMQDLEVTPDVLSHMQRKVNLCGPVFKQQRKVKYGQLVILRLTSICQKGFFIGPLRKAVSRFLRSSFRKVFDRQFWQFLTMPFWQVIRVHVVH